MPKVEILGVAVDAQPFDKACDRMEGWIKQQTGGYVCITGVHGIVESLSSDPLRQMHNEATMVTSDGMPLVWLSRYLRPDCTVERVYGPDLMLEMFRRSETAGWRHFLYGSTTETLDLLEARLRSLYPRSEVAGKISPPFGPLEQDDADAFVEEIKATDPHIIWVGLSTPKQEMWMARHYRDLAPAVLVGVGAAFDFHAGLKRQAPPLVQRMGFEWAFRLCVEPRRLWRRYLRANTTFVTRLALTAPLLRRRRKTATSRIGAG